MTIKCFLGFHKWRHQFYIIKKEGPKTYIELRVCENCNITDAFSSFYFDVLSGELPKFVRTSALVQFEEGMPDNLTYIGDKTIEDWYFKYVEKRELERENNGI